MQATWTGGLHPPLPAAAVASSPRHRSAADAAVRVLAATRPQAPHPLTTAGARQGKPSKPRPPGSPPYWSLTSSDPLGRAISTGGCPTFRRHPVCSPIAVSAAGRNDPGCPPGTGRKIASWRSKRTRTSRNEILSNNNERESQKEEQANCDDSTSSTTQHILKAPRRRIRYTLNRPLGITSLPHHSSGPPAPRTRHPSPRGAERSSSRRKCGRWSMTMISRAASEP